MKDRPISDISIKEICALADVSRSTFYAHYHDPYDLLHRIEDDAMAYYEKISAKYDYKLSDHDLQQLIIEKLQFVYDNANFIQVLFSEHGDIEFQKKCFDFSPRKNIRKRFSKRVDDQKTYEFRLVFTQNGNIAIIQHWMKTGMKKPIDELAKLIIELNVSIL
jgi:AcrR family transcriptional regulator